MYVIYKVINKMSSPKEIIMIILQMIIIKSAISNGWTINRLNNNQIEFTKKLNKYENYEKNFCDIILSSLEKTKLQY